MKELIKELTELRDTIQKFGLVDEVILIHQAIQALSQSEWINVEDRLPKNNVGVLVFIPIEDNHITSGMYDYDNKWVLLDDYRLIEDDKQITHWMPLPQQPQTK